MSATSQFYIFGALKIIINLNVCNVETIGLQICSTVLEYGTVLMQTNKTQNRNFPSRKRFML